MKYFNFRSWNLKSWQEYIKNNLNQALKLTLAIGLILVLVLGSPHRAEAASRGGRVGGGSFRSAPTRTYRAPTRTYSPSPVSPYGAGGAGFSPFFFLPFFGFGGGGLGGLFGLMVLLTVGGFIVRTLQSVLTGNENGEGSVPGLGTNPTVSVAKIQVGLSSQAQQLQTDLTRMALAANTETQEGLVKVLQETTLGLLRNPEYWCYGKAHAVQTKLQDGEARFNRLLLEERSKLRGESLSNVKGNLQKSTPVIPSEKTLAEELTIVDSRTYIVVTLLVGITGKLLLSDIQSEADLKQAIQLLGSISAEQLLSLEIIWVPQASEEVLTADELVAQYPDLTLL